MKINIAKIKETLNPKTVFRGFSDFLVKKMRWIIFILLFVALGYGVYFWYVYVQNPGWSEQKKQEYIKTKDRGSVFNKAKFNEVVAEFEERKNNYQHNMSDLQDIFKLKE
ncbi:MAG TPA: hypothetical protein PLK35_03620 [Candidatus Moranbacteria bacterium]|nr:hypothetical protein [Candidatus Moranbacteria bacterium]